MKILHLLYSNSYSGAEKVALSIIRNMSKFHPDVESIYVSRKGNIEKKLEEEGVDYFLLNNFRIMEK